MPEYMDYHPDLKLPEEAVKQLREDARSEKFDEFGVRQIELYHNEGGNVYCLLEAPNVDAVKKHHEALGVPCGEVHEVNKLA